MFADDSWLGRDGFVVFVSAFSGGPVSTRQKALDCCVGDSTRDRVDWECLVGVNVLRQSVRMLLLRVDDDNDGKLELDPIRYQPHLTGLRKECV